MTTISISTNEDIHPVCLMYGLKQAYRQFPMLVHNIMATPPPFYSSPKQKRLFIGSRRNTASVQYHKSNITIIYDKSRASEEMMADFAKAVIVEYVRLRHPYLVTEWNELKFVECHSDRFIAEII